jgi:hypothetical protein
MSKPTTEQIDRITHVIGELHKVIDGTRKTGWGDDEDTESNLRDISDRLLSIAESDYPPTFTEWMQAQFETSDLEDIVNHGVDGGFSGLIYYNELSRLYDRYDMEIWDALVEDAEEIGHENVPAMIATWKIGDVTSTLGFKSALVWFMAERVAFRLTEGAD